MALGSTQPLTEMSTGEFPGSKGGRYVRLTTLTPSCAVVMKSGNLNFLEPSGPLQACNGTDLPFYLFIAVKCKVKCAFCVGSISLPYLIHSLYLSILGSVPFRRTVPWLFHKVLLIAAMILFLSGGSLVYISVRLPSGMFDIFVPLIIGVSPCLLYCADVFLCCLFRTYVNSALYNLSHSSGTFNELSTVSTYIYHTVVSIFRKSASTHIPTIPTIAASNCATPVLQSTYIAIATAG